MIESKNKKKQSVVIIGASGHGKVVADIVVEHDDSIEDYVHISVGVYLRLCRQDYKR